MDLVPMYSPDHAARIRAGGFWQDFLLTDRLDEAPPDKVAIVDRDNVLRYRDLIDRVRVIALMLHRLGVGQGDVVSFQLPNWWQFAALHLACLRIGAVTNPLMPIFRERELSFMLGLAESKVFIVPDRFRGFDFAAMAEGLRGGLPALEHVLVIGSDAPSSFEAAVARTEDDMALAAALFASSRPGADDVIEIVYTSGTTGEPKGAMQTSNILLSNIVAYAERIGLARDDVFFVPSPMAHQTGFLYGFAIAVLLGATAVYQDIWQPERAADLIERHGATFSMASTPFLSDLADVAERRPASFTSLRSFVAGGAPIPRALVTRASQALEAKILSGWGMTENGAITVTPPDAPLEKAVESDGCPLPGVELRILDAEGAVLPAGSEGRLQARACSMFAGYLKRPKLYTVDREGWFDTGDLARLDSEGYVRITGRSKDIIIRGGENIPVVEVENLLYRHPAVQEVAIVAMPDARLGERACAFIVPRHEQTLGFDEIIAFLEAQKLSRSYLPERIEFVEALPHTPSGKIQKFKLREIVRGLRAGA